MSTNFRQPGETVYAPCPAAVSSGDLVVIGDALVGVAQVDGAQNEVIAFDRVGVFELPKTTPQTWTVGDIIWWDAGTGKATNVTGSGLLKIGIALGLQPTYATAAGSAATTGDVLLVPNL